MNEFENKDFIGGPFDVCQNCEYEGKGCSGPRTTAMTHERYVSWMKVLVKKRGFTHQQIADATGVSKSTIDDMFAGRRKDISRTTAGLLEDYLIGGDAKWPCAMHFTKDKNVVLQDRPETLQALEEKCLQVDRLRRDLDEFKVIMGKEIATVRAEYEDDIKFYKEHIALMREQIRRKDRYIDILMDSASNGGGLKPTDIKEP